MVAFEQGQRRYQIRCRDRPSSVLADPKEGACALVIAAGVLGTMMVIALGLRRLDTMQRNVKQVSMPLSGRYLITADAFVHAVFDDTLWTLTF